MLPGSTRRDFLKLSMSALVSATALTSGRAASAPMKTFPIGMQLFAVRDLLTKDFGATLKQIAALGFEEVEAAGFLTLTAAEVKAAMKDAGVRCVSGHYPMQSWQTQLDANLKFASEAGLKVRCLLRSGAQRPEPRGRDVAQSPTGCDDARRLALECE